MSVKRASTVPPDYELMGLILPRTMRSFPFYTFKLIGVRAPSDLGEGGDGAGSDLIARKKNTQCPKARVFFKRTQNCSEKKNVYSSHVE